MAHESGFRIKISKNILFHIVVLFEIMPIFKGYLHAYTEMVILALISLNILLYGLHNPIIGGFQVICIVFLILASLIRNDELLLQIYKIFSSFIVIMIPFYVKDCIGFDELRKLFRILLFSIILTEITSIIALVSDPLVARAIITAHAAEGSSQIAKLNVGGYSLAYMAPVVLICLYSLMKSGFLNHKIYYLYLIITIVFVVMTQFMIAIILLMVTIAMIYLSKANYVKAIVILLFGTIIGLLLAPTISKSMLGLASQIDTYNIRIRIIEIANMLNSNLQEGTDLMGRFERMMISIQTFIDHPILGGFLYGGKIGGHNSIFDYLANTGLLGMPFFILFFTQFKKQTIDTVNIIKYKQTVQLSFIMFFAFALLNPAFYSDVFLILSICIVYTCSVFASVSRE